MSFIKSAFDRVGAGLGVLVLLPLLIGIGLAVRLTSHGPAIFKKTRVGPDGEHFAVWKLRTMHVDAEARLAELQDLNEHDGVLFMVRDDPRITRMGKWLRKYSIDELPQLVNVLRGDMSLVGPRPPLPSEVAHCGGHTHRRLLVKPGITGLWQVSGRSDLSWEDTVRLDLQYVENRSLGLDLAILVRTVATVVKGSGAGAPHAGLPLVRSEAPSRVKEPSVAELGVSWAEAGRVVVSTVGIYLTFLVLLRLVGQRVLTSPSTFDFAAAVAMGAVMGRALLGWTPTLLAGVIGLITLFALQTVFGLLRRTPRLQAAMVNPPMVLLRDGRVLHDNLRSAHLLEDELRERLRAHGIRSYDDVACAVLERTGAVSVLRVGDPISDDLLADVKGWD